MKIAVVILNWNGKDFLERFLPSVYSSLCCKGRHDWEIELVVADNGSTDSSYNSFINIYNRLFPNTKEGAIAEQDKRARNNVVLKWLQLSSNFGFTGGYNRALASIWAEGTKSHSGAYDYYVLLNSDILTPDGWLTPLAEFMESRREVAICQPKILSYSRHLERVAHQSNEPEQFEYAGASGGFIDSFGFPFCRGRILSAIEDDTGQYDTPIRVFWASGACLMIRAELFHRSGGLDEKFFAHMEEIDLCWRVALMGHQIWCVPQSAVYHVGGGTLPNNSPRKLYLNYRNNLLMLWKNLPQRGLGAKIFLRKCLDGLSAAIYLLKGDYSFAQAVWRAHKDYNKLHKSSARSPRLASTQKPYGQTKSSIILKFFLGKKRFSQLRESSFKSC
ncbi:MAG: glycosyltransferase family 2 protein [Bacteroidales bacterium]|nr:glycosyltransferase family 2 protein [Bacteroidales bacterium]